MDSIEIVEAMERVRRDRPQRMHLLREEAHRLTDWREHVKASPMLWLAASAGVGFYLARRDHRAQPSTVHATPEMSDARRMPARSVTGAVTRTAFSLLMPMATQVVRSYIASQMAGVSSLTDHHED